MAAKNVVCRYNIKKTQNAYKGRRNVNGEGFFKYGKELEKMDISFLRVLIKILDFSFETSPLAHQVILQG